MNHCEWDTFNTVDIECEPFTPRKDDVRSRGGLQFADQRSVGDELVGSFNTRSAGAKPSLGYKSIITSTSFAWSAKGGGLRKPWGRPPGFNSVMLSDFDLGGERAI